MAINKESDINQTTPNLDKVNQQQAQVVGQADPKVKSGRLSIETENIFPIIRQWLYADQDIFVRELVANACDAINKRQSLIRLGELETEFEPEIQVVFDKEARTLSFSDNGIGMTATEIDKYINQIAFSGAVDFMEKYQNDRAAVEGIIGHFGLGFYSAFMPAAKVKIESLSAVPSSLPAVWISEDGIEYSLSQGQKSLIGTEITITLSDEATQTIDAAFVRQTLNKYCAFMPYPIYFHDVETEKNAALAKEQAKETEAEVDPSIDVSAAAETLDLPPVPINDTNPLWLKAPAECTAAEYEEFYQKTFHDFKKPLFWIHLNMDYPFKLKGILYFPRYEEKLPTLDGRIKLYNNQVFVADNIKEVIPDFLFLLRGCLDCPELPLNVSRSFLQQDEYVKKLSSHIIRKVADKLTEVFRKDRPAYENAWPDIALFVKYGMLREAKFYEKAESALLFKEVDGDWLTLTDLLNTIYYTVDPSRQAYYVARTKSKGHQVIILKDEIDTPFMSFLEQKRQDTKFIAVDSETEEAKGSEALLKPLQTIFQSIEDVCLEVAALGADALPAILVETEEGQRAKSMKAMFQQMGSDVNDPSFAGMFSSKPKLLLNTDNVAIQHLVDLEGETQTELRDQIYDLARLSYGSLKGQELLDFLNRSSKLLQQLTDK